MAQKIKIAIADDHNLVRESFALALQTDSNFQIVFQAENGRELIEEIPKVRPDVVILDLEMPVMNGWDALTHLKKYSPATKVVIVSMHFQGLIIKDLVARGAHGFLPKNADFETLINAIYEVHDLGYFFSRKINNSIVRELLSSNSINPLFRDASLSEGELTTLHLVCEDKVTREIAEIMGMTERTVERYRSSLYKKTKTKTPAGLFLYALKNNIITVHP
jgi:DNA-binding NarL/FixJ family response regulator